MNKLCLIGNVTRDAELRSTPNGVAVCSFTVAVNNRRRGNNSDNQQTPEDTIFVRVTIWRERATSLAGYIKKGQKVYVEGPLQQPRIWKGNDGVDHAELQMTCETFEFCSSRNDGAGYQPAQDYQQSAPAVPQSQNSGFQQVAQTDDLPF